MKLFHSSKCRYYPINQPDSSISILWYCITLSQVLCAVIKQIHRILCLTLEYQTWEVPGSRCWLYWRNPTQFPGDKSQTSRWKWPCTLWQILYKRKRNALWFWQHFGRTITLAVSDISIVSTESQVLYSFIIKVRMDTLIFYFLIFFW